MRIRHVALVLALLLLCLLPALGRGSGVIPALRAGDRLTVTAVTPIDDEASWYALQLPDGTIGYLRSDSIVPEMTMEAAYIGNAKSKVFHRPTCKNLPSEKNAVELSSRDEAVKQGYTPCGNCDP